MEGGWEGERDLTHTHKPFLLEDTLPYQCVGTLDSLCELCCYRFHVFRQNIFFVQDSNSQTAVSRWFLLLSFKHWLDHFQSPIMAEFHFLIKHDRGIRLLNPYFVNFQTNEMRRKRGYGVVQWLWRMYHTRHRWSTKVQQQITSVYVSKPHILFYDLVSRNDAFVSRCLLNVKTTKLFKETEDSITLYLNLFCTE